MESIVERDTAQIAETDSNKNRLQVEAYLRAWRLPVAWVNEIADEIANAGVSDAESAIIEVDQRICQRLQTDPKGLSVDPRLALLCSGAMGHWDREPIAKSCANGAESFKRTTEPSRPLQTYLTTMDSSLSSLPSFRMIAGWFALATSLILAFIFTH